MRKKLSLITLLVISMLLLASCNPKDYLMAAMGDVNKEEVVITPENIDEYIGLKACEGIYDAPYTVCFTNKRLDDGYAILEATKTEETVTLYFPNEIITYEGGIDIFDFFNGFTEYYSEWDAEYYAENAKASDVLSDLGDYEITLKYVSLDNPTVNVTYYEDTNQRKLTYGLNRRECSYCKGNEF